MSPLLDASNKNRFVTIFFIFIIMCAYMSVFDRDIPMYKFPMVENQALTYMYTVQEENLRNNFTTDEIERINLETKKIILYYGDWFGNKWNSWFKDEGDLKGSGCPFYNCQFTYNRSLLNEADLVIFSTDKTSTAYNLNRSNFLQRWAYVDLEAPYRALTPYLYYLLDYNPKTVFNWTFTYHSNADIVTNYGYFNPINRNHSERQIRLNKMNYGSETMKSYLDSLNRGETMMSDIFGNFSLTNRPHLAAWMSSRCPVTSRRKEVIANLQKFMKIDTFGKCGTKVCHRTRSPVNPRCWEDTLAPNYLFYFSMENSLCDEYITEKVYLPLIFGLVPVVYGNSNYSQFLPPHSFINLRDHDPKDLAQLLIGLQNDPVEYGRYHLWRKFWTVELGSSSCEICYKLNTNHEIKYYKNVAVSRMIKEQCD